MMDEDEIYNELNNRIREVFDNYEDTTADEGWELLRQKFPEKRRKRAAAWIWYAAAAIVLLCLSVWFIDRPQVKPTQLAKAPKNSVQPQHPAPVSSQHDSLNYAQNNQPIATPGNAQALHPTNQVQAVQPTFSKPQNNKSIIPAQSTQNNYAANLLRQNNTTVNKTTGMQQQPPAVNPTTNSNAMAQSNKPNIGYTNTHQPAAVNPAVNANAVALSNKDSVAAKTKAYITIKSSADGAEKYAAATAKPKPVITSAESMQKLLNEKNAPKVLNDQTPKSGKKTVIGLYAATYFNYAKGSDNKVNMGAGVSSDFRITKNLKLSTGLAIAQNSLNYNNGLPGSPQSLQLYANTKAKAALDHVYSRSSIASFSATPLAAIAAPALTSYNANLVGLDIPVNLKFEINPQKTDAYISAGLSSGTFINETYTLNYIYARNAQQSVMHTNFAGFDFAKTLNLSFGVGTPIGKSNRLVIEPFLKYPLDGLGSQQIKFGAGGVNLKLNFTPGKK